MEQVNTVVLVPRRAGNPYRDEVWEWLQGWWASQVGWPIFEGHHDDGPFNRSLAVNRAEAAAREAVPGWDVALIIDSDVLCDPIQIRAAVGAAHVTGGHVLGYHERIHLQKAGTRRILDGYRGDWRPFTRTQLFDACSSMNAIPRGLWETVGGFDEGFCGWGWEDIAFRISTELLGPAPLVKIQGTLWHLWHPKSPENDQSQETFRLNRDRGARYKEARAARDAAAVRVLLAERDRLRADLAG